MAGGRTCSEHPNPSFRWKLQRQGELFDSLIAFLSWKFSVMLLLRARAAAEAMSRADQVESHWVV